MAAPSDSGMHVTATNKSAIAKESIYQCVIFRSPEFLEMAAITNVFPTIAVTLIMRNKADSEMVDERLRFDSSDVNDTSTDIVLVERITILLCLNVTDSIAK